MLEKYVSSCHSCFMLSFSIFFSCNTFYFPKETHLTVTLVCLKKIILQDREDFFWCWLEISGMVFVKYCSSNLNHWYLPQDSNILQKINLFPFFKRINDMFRISFRKRSYWFHFDTDIFLDDLLILTAGSCMSGLLSDIRPCCSPCCFN